MANWLTCILFCGLTIGLPKLLNLCAGRVGSLCYDLLLETVFS